MARYKPNVTNNGNAIPIEATDANAMLALNGSHDSRRKSNANQTATQQNATSTTTTTRRFAALGIPNKYDAA